MHYHSIRTLKVNNVEITASYTFQGHIFRRRKINLLFINKVVRDQFYSFSGEFRYIDLSLLCDYERSWRLKLLSNYLILKLNIHTVAVD